MKKQFITVIALMLVLLSSCTQEEQDPAELIVGKWIISSTELLGTSYPGDGSYLKFEACSGTCMGTDYKASDTTTGSFDYDLNSDGTVLIITDTMSEGGNYNFTFDVLELTKNDLRMTAETGLFGNMLVVLSKE